MDISSVVVNSIVGEGTIYNGTIEAVDLLRIDGTFSGTAHSHDVILIGITGRAKGTLSSSRIVIAGMFDGNIRNTDLVILQPTSVVLGKIEAKSVIVESSALMSSLLKVVRPSLDKDLENGEQEGRELRPLFRTVEKLSNKTLAKIFSK